MAKYRIKDDIGKRLGRLVKISGEYCRYPKSGLKPKYYALYQCICNSKVIERRVDSIKSTSSCGCLKAEIIKQNSQKPEFKEKMKLLTTGRLATWALGNKNSLGKIRSEETKRKISESVKNCGYEHSKEALNKISEAQKNRNRPSLEVIEKITKNLGSYILKGSANPKWSGKGGIIQLFRTDSRI